MGKKTKNLHELKIVVMARKSLTGHISLAVFQDLICLGAWGSYPQGLKTEGPYHFSTAAAKTITSSQHRTLEHNIKTNKPGWFIGVNDCTDWVLKTLHSINIKTPSDKLLPMNLMKAFLEHSDWEEFYVPRIVTDLWNRC